MKSTKKIFNSQNISKIIKKSTKTKTKSYYNTNLYHKKNNKNLTNSNLYIKWYYQRLKYVIKC